MTEKEGGKTPQTFTHCLITHRYQNGLKWSNGQPVLISSEYSKPYDPGCVSCCNLWQIICTERVGLFGQLALI